MAADVRGPVVQLGSVAGNLNVGAVPVAPVAAVPRELPLDVLGFSGRQRQLAELDRLQALAGEQAAAVVISAIDGMAGVGKTALAVHAAHRLVDRFPDGQLFVDLHGYTPDVPPVDPAAALEQMLRSFRIRGENIPAAVEERSALLRTRLAGKRVLVVLDNAATDSQVRPLLPGTPGCLVVVTSRTRLTGLDDAIPLSLDVLPAGDAVALFTQAVGGHRLTDAGTGVVEEIIELCGRLPLAIRIAAARLRHRPTWTPVHLAELLRDERSRLGELHAGQLSLVTALGVSYAQLTAVQQRVLRLLSLHPGADIDPYATAALTDTTPSTARRILEQLLDVHLLVQRVPGRYAFHNLVRAYATERADASDPEPDRDTALSRLFNHYGHAATVAMDTMYPHGADRRPHPPRPHAPLPNLHDPARAEAWLDTERSNLLATARTAGHHRPDHTIHLSATLHRHLRTRTRYTDALTLHRHAHTLAQDTGNRTGELNALHGLGDVHRLRGRYGQAVEHFGRVLEIADDIGDRNGELDALYGLGKVHWLQGRYGQAVEHFGRALEIARETGDRNGELGALYGLGEVHRLRGRYGQAVEHFGRVLEIAHDIGDRNGELNALYGLGEVHRSRGRYGQAVEHFGRVLEIAQDTGDRNGELNALYGLGEVHRLRGRYGQAVEHFGQALEIASDIGARNGQFEAHHGLGRVHGATGDHDRALVHQRVALDLATELGQPTDQVRAHDGLAHTHHAIGQFEVARRHWQTALDILTTQGGDHTDDPHVTRTTLRAHLTDPGQPRTPPE